MNSKQTYKSQHNYKDQFSKGSLPQPKDSEEKDNSWFLKWAKHIYGLYSSGRCGVMPGGVNSRGIRYRTLRMYAEGNQDIEKYMKIIDDPAKTDAGDVETFNNIDWSNHKVMDKFIELMRGKFGERRIAATTTAIDETASFERRKKVALEKMLATPTSQQLISRGVEPKQQSQFKDVGNKKDVETLINMGGIRLNSEIMIKDAIDGTNYESNIETIRSQVEEDIIKLKIAAVHVAIERASGIVKYKYIDPENLVFRSSQYDDCRDIDFAGYVEKKTIAQIRMESNLEEKDLYKIAKSYKSFGDNSSQQHGWGSEYRANYHDNTGYYHYDTFTADVLTIYLISSDVENSIIQEDNKQISEWEKSTKVDIGGKPQKTGVNIQNVYRIHYVVGTNYVYDCGLEYGVVRKGKSGIKRAQLPIVIWKGTGPSVVEKCIPHLDDIQLAVLKKRAILAKLPPGPRMAWDLSLMNDTIDIGGNQYTMKQMIQAYGRVGSLFYQSISEFGLTHEGSMRKPFEILQQSGIAEDMALIFQEISAGFDMIREATGINPVADGTTTQHDMLKGTMEGLQASTNTALKKIMDASLDLHKRLFQHVAKKWQLSVLNGDVDIESIPANDSTLRVYKITKSIFAHEFGIMVHLLPSSEEKQMMLNDLMRKENEGKIAGDAYLLVRNMIMQDDLKKAALFMAQAVKQREEVLHQRSVQLQEATASANGKASQMAEEARANTTKVEYEGKSKLSAQEHLQKMDEIRLEKRAELLSKSVEKEAIQNN